MKKFIVILLLFISGVVFASPQKVPVVWAFVPSSTQGVYIQEICRQANIQQSKYEFVFEAVQGAGGYIATRKVISDNKVERLSILAQSSALFVRPFLYPTAAHSFEELKPLMVISKSSAILVSRGRSLDQLLNQKRITMATAGAGSTTHLFAEAFARDVKINKPEIIFEMVHYKNSPEAFVSVMGGHVDLTFEFIGNAKGSATPETRFLGLTGGTRIDNIPLLSDLGFKGMSNMTNVFTFSVGSNVPNEKVTELQSILLLAEKTSSVQNLYKLDFASKEDMFGKPGDLNKWYIQTVKDYEGYTKGIEVK